jgi:uncharacterized cupredoxin-like copper-binding protein
MKNPSTSATILRPALLTLALSAAMAAPATHADAKHHQPQTAAALSTEETAFGKPGNLKKATRTIAIDMNDMMRFVPADIKVRRGETIRFVVKNKGKMMHEIVLGTMDELKAHGEMMKKHPGMEHDAPYMTHVGPGRKDEMVWQFTKAGEFHYACLIPGHFEAGMVGKITVTKG